MSKQRGEAEIDAEVWCDSMSAVLDLPIAAAYRDGVIVNLNVIAVHAARVRDFTYDDREEPASVYRA